MSDNKKEFDELDDFWSLDDMLPKKSEPQTPIKFDTETAEIVISGEKPPQSQTVPPQSEFIDYSAHIPSVIHEYTPKNPFITKVSISARRADSRLNENFIANAYRYFSQSGREAAAVPFNSYIPQYTQMNPQQLNHYFYFRDQARKGKFISTYSSYICLFAYEVINLTDKYPPESQLDILSGLLCAYPDSSDSLFKNLCNWLCDICLLNDLSPPLEKLSHIMPKILENVCLKEVFFPTNNPICDTTALYFFNSANYDYKKSRFYNDVTASFFDKHIAGAFSYAISKISENDSRFSQNALNFATLKFESFRGALCTSRVKRFIAAECICITRSQHVRDTVTNLVKYIENQIRSLLGIASKLTVNYLTATDKSYVNTYFLPFKTRLSSADASEITKITGSVHASRLKPQKTKRHAVSLPPVTPEYESLYEPKVKEFSLHEAEAIEKKSWKITNILTTTFSDEKPFKNSETSVPVSANSDEKPQKSPASPTPTTKGDILDEKPSKNPDKTLPVSANSGNSSQNIIKKAINLALDGNFTAMKEIARQEHIYFENLVEQINTIFLDKIGDILLEPTENGYILIEDYRADAKAFAEEK